MYIMFPSKECDIHVNDFGWKASEQKTLESVLLKFQSVHKILVMFETIFDTQPPRWEDLSYLQAWEYLKDYVDNTMYICCMYL